MERQKKSDEALLREALGYFESAGHAIDCGINCLCGLDVFEEKLRARLTVPKQEGEGA